MGPCTLKIGSRVVLVSHDGPPAAELAMFDARDIELVPGEGGGAREAGYQTVAYEARRRLAVAGITLALADEAAEVVRPALSLTYSRGAVVRRVARKLGATELFEGRVYDGTLRRYEGGWLDLPLLANDAGIAGGTPLLQALGLIAILAEVSDDAPVALSTLGYTQTARIGERTLRKHALDGARALPQALMRLATRASPPPLEAPPGPTREELVARLRDRVRATPLEAVRDHLLELERGLARRDRPTDGPLSDPTLWAIETQLDDGDVIGVLDRLYTREQVRGREPGTTYLRAKTALLLGQEPPRVLAERVSQLVLTMRDFPELELLAAQAWVVAGEPRRGLPYARDLIQSPSVHPELKSIAEAIVNPKVGRTPRTGDRPLDLPPPESVDDRAVRAERPRTPPPASGPRSGDPRRESVTDARIEPEPPTEPRRQVPPASDAPETRRAARSLTPPPAPIASPRPGEVGPSASLRTSSPMPSSKPSSKPPSSAKPGSSPASRRRPSSNPAREMGDVRPSQWPSSMPAPREEPYRPEHVDHTPASAPGSRRFMKGASLPPYASEPPQKAAAPIVPRVDVEDTELVETLTLPPRATEEMTRGAQMPQSPLEARVRCTLAARQLARYYRVELGLELRLGEEAVDLMERHLLARFPSHVLRDVEEAREAQLHGALLSEVVARTLAGEWVDVAPTEFGYWAMVVPTADGRGKRVWPFGRVLRFIASGGAEDLLGYYRKLRDMR